MSEEKPPVSVVVVGGGQAGGEIAMELRRAGFQGKVTLVCDEAHPPYKRPPLSKTFLAGEIEQKNLYVAQEPILEKNNIECRRGIGVTAIDREARQVRLSDGSTLGYDRLALATGGRARKLELPGADQAGVLPLRSIADVEQIRSRMAPGRHMVIIGGGFIGLEVAATAIKQGLKVTLLEGLPRVLARVTTEAVSTFYERVHREAGVDLRTGSKIEGFEARGEGVHVKLAGGDGIDADFVVYGIGQLPNVELAEKAGLKVDNGIVVDELGRTSDPAIVAAGDCTSHPNEYAGRHIRLESVQNAMDQARAAARAIAGNPQPYRAVPWFWSDQYDLKLQMAGLSTGHDATVMRGDPDSRSFAVFYLKGNTLIAADTVNRQPDHLLVRKMLAAGVSPDPAQLADDSVPLKSLLPA